MSRLLRSASLLLFTLMLTGLASCGGSGGGTTLPGAESIPLTQLLHPNTPVVAQVDMDGLRSSPYYDSLRQLLVAFGAVQGEDGHADSLFGLLDSSDHFVVGTDPFGGGSDETLIALRGAFGPRHLNVLPGFDETESYRTHSLRGRGSEWLVVPTDDTFLYGGQQQVHDGLDRLDGVFPGSGPSRPGFTEAATRARLGDRDVSLVWVFTDEMRAAMGQGELEHVLQENGVSAGMSLQLRDGAQLDGFITTNDAAAVPLLARGLREALTEAAESPFVVGLGANAILEQVELHEEGTTFRVTVGASDAQVRELLSNALRLVQMASGG